MSDAGAPGTAFETLMGHLDYPMFVVTTAVEEDLAGCLVGFATQASINPPRFLVGLSNKNHTYRVAKHATHLAVHALRVDEKDLARLFGEETGDRVNKFDRCEWQPGPHGLPILDAAVAWFSGRILQQSPVGDHVAFLVEVDGGNVLEELGALLSFSEVKDLEAGHEA